MSTSDKTLSPINRAVRALAWSTVTVGGFWMVAVGGVVLLDWLFTGNSIAEETGSLRGVTDGFLLRASMITWIGLVVLNYFNVFRDLLAEDEKPAKLKLGDDGEVVSESREPDSSPQYTYTHGNIREDVG